MRYCYEGIDFAFCKSFYNNYFYYYSTLCCYWLAYIWPCAVLIPFLELLLFCEDYFFWEESPAWRESFCLLFEVEPWFKPVFVAPDANACFFVLLLGPSFCFNKYSAAPGTGNLLWIYIDYLSNDKHEKGLVKN